MDTVEPTGRGLVLLLPDPPEIERLSRRVAARLNASIARLDSTHCWMARDPDRVHDLLRAFWATL
jgi:hypothetical protein